MLLPHERIPALRYLNSLDMNSLTFVNIGQFKGGVQLAGPHHHREFEVLYHTSGKGLIRFDDRPETVRAYDLAFIPPGAVHAEASDPQFLKALIWLRFRTDTGGAACPPFTLTDAGGRMRADFEALLRDYEENGLYADELCRARLGLIVRGIQRLAAEAPGPGDAAAWVQSYLYQHYDEAVNIGDLAHALGFSASHLVTVFSRRFGQSPGRFLIERRLEVARSALASGEEPIGRVAAQVGFDDPLYFSRMFKKYCGATPSAYRKHFREAVPPAPPNVSCPLPPGCAP